jgi:hypothetical protein
MKRYTRLSLTTFLTAACLFAGAALSSEYIYKDLAGSTLPPAKCAAKEAASASSQDDYTVRKFVKTFCETQGYGWHVAEENGNGKLICEECASEPGKFQCHLEDVLVTCKRLKPGSVGMLPGKG